HCRRDYVDPIGTRLPESVKGRSKIVGSTDIGGEQLDAEAPRHFRHRPRTDGAACRWVVEDAQAFSVGQEFLEYLDLLRLEFGREDADAGYVTAGLRQAGSHTGIDEIVGDTDDGKRRRGGSCGL